MTHRLEEKKSRRDRSSGNNEKGSAAEEKSLTDPIITISCILLAERPGVRRKQED